MNLSVETSVGEFVAQDFRAAEVFSRHKIDFCCKGGKSLTDACKNSAADAAKVLEELNLVLANKSAQDTDFNSFSLSLLVDYILEKHHVYVVSKSPVLLGFLDKLCSVHGANHPELFEVYKTFTALTEDLSSHLQKEEMILFPYIKELDAAAKGGVNTPSCGFGTVQNPVKMMMMEHETAGELLVLLSNLTNNYAPPADGCTTYSVAFTMLKEFEQDLHKHIHLENNILFKKAVEVEGQKS